MGVIDNVLVYGNEEDGYYAYFKDWLTANHGQDWDGIYNDLCVEDKSEDERFETKQELLEDFYDWCETNGIEGVEV